MHRRHELADLKYSTDGIISLVFMISICEFVNCTPDINNQHNGIMKKSAFLISLLSYLLALVGEDVEHDHVP